MEMRNLKLVLIITGALSLLIVGVACGDRSAETVADSTTETSPTAGPITQTTPTPKPTAETAPTATNVPAQVVAPSVEGIEGMLSGDTLARYRALPPAFQTALDTYAWFGVPSDLIPLAARDKMDQWVMPLFHWPRSLARNEPRGFAIPVAIPRLCSRSAYTCGTPISCFRATSICSPWSRPPSDGSNSCVNWPTFP